MLPTCGQKRPFLPTGGHRRRCIIIVVVVVFYSGKTSRSNNNKTTTEYSGRFGGQLAVGSRQRTEDGGGEWGRAGGFPPKACGNDV